jgi:hypothetical protein
MLLGGLRCKGEVVRGSRAEAAAAGRGVAVPHPVSLVVALCPVPMAEALHPGRREAVPTTVVG